MRFPSRPKYFQRARPVRHDVPHRRAVFQPRLECLENRLAPAIYTVADGDLTSAVVFDAGTNTFQGGLISCITHANSVIADTTNTIRLFTAGNYTLTAVNNSSSGPSGLPVITAAGKTL